jgi:hypothetical protein
MAKKKDGITELTKLLVSASKKFTKTEYSGLTSVVFAMLHGVNYGYNEMDQRFLTDALDIYELHQDNKDLKKTSSYVSSYKNHKPDPSMISNFKRKKTKYKDNVIQLKDFSKGAVNDNG